jgi:hypothetical protein
VVIIGIASPVKLAEESKTIMALWQTLVEIDNITALKAFAPAVDGDKRLIKSPSSIITIPPAWYYYDASATYTELLPAIVEPESGVGRWIMLDPLVISFNAPVEAPPFTGIKWIKVNAHLEWLSKQIDSTLQWVSTSSQLDLLFSTTSQIVTLNGTISQGSNTLEFLCLSGSAAIAYSAPLNSQLLLVTAS